MAELALRFAGVALRVPVALALRAGTVDVDAPRFATVPVRPPAALRFVDEAALFREPVALILRAPTLDAPFVADAERLRAAVVVRPAAVALRAPTGDLRALVVRLVPARDVPTPRLVALVEVFPAALRVVLAAPLALRRVVPVWPSLSSDDRVCRVVRPSSAVRF